MISLPCETRKEGEEGWEKTTIRGIHEELGLQVPLGHDCYWSLNPEKPVVHDYETPYRLHLHVSVVDMRALGADITFRADPWDAEDVEHARWTTYGEMCQMMQTPGLLRQEMRLVLGLMAEKMQLVGEAT